jgi:hypothetical protein
MDMQCVADCTPSLLTTLVAFFSIAVVGVILASIQRKFPIAWVPISSLVALPFLANGWGLGGREWLAIGSAWFIVLLTAYLKRRIAPGEANANRVRI